MSFNALGWNLGYAGLATQYQRHQRNDKWLMRPHKPRSVHSTLRATTGGAHVAPISPLPSLLESYVVCMPEADALPVYVQDSTNDANAVPLPPEASAGILLHVFTSSVHLTTAEYNLQDKLGSKWATLKLQSRSWTNTGTPVYRGGDVVRGEFTLDLNQQERMKDISVVIRGVINYGTSSNIFLEHRRSLWSNDCSGNLLGRYSWPFTLTFPKKALLQLDSKTTRPYALPPTFYDETKRWAISYQVEVTMLRVARPDVKLVAPIHFVPLSRPEDLPPPGQLDYRESMRFLGPEADPDGWEALEPVLMVGNISGSRPIAVTCKLAISSPLCYVRGTAIRCILTIETGDAETLALLTSESVPQVKLIRKVGFEKEMALRTTPGDGKTRDIPEQYVNIVSTMALHPAVWWRSDEQTGSNARRCTLNGQIRLDKDLIPSCFFPGIVILYEVSMYPSQAPEFIPAGGRDRALLRKAVDIVADQPEGPRLAPEVPPPYASVSEHPHGPRTPQRRRSLSKAFGIARPLLSGRSSVPRRKRFSYAPDSS